MATYVVRRNSTRVRIREDDFISINGSGRFKVEKVSRQLISATSLDGKEKKVVHWTKAQLLSGQALTSESVCS